MFPQHPATRHALISAQHAEMRREAAQVRLARQLRALQPTPVTLRPASRWRMASWALLQRLHRRAGRARLTDRHRHRIG